MLLHPPRSHVCCLLLSYPSQLVLRPGQPASACSYCCQRRQHSKCSCAKFAAVVRVLLQAATVKICLTTSNALRLHASAALTHTQGTNNTSVSPGYYPSQPVNMCCSMIHSSSTLHHIAMRACCTVLALVVPVLNLTANDQLKARTKTGLVCVATPHNMVTGHAPILSIEPETACKHDLSLLCLSHLLSHKKAAVHQRKDHHRYGQRYAEVGHS
jgi:hypothetical protein